MLFFNNFEIFASICKSGCVVFVHHLETVTGSFPNLPASQTPVLPASANTPLILFRFSMRNS